MKTVKVLDRQTVFDIAMQELGVVDRSFEIADLNGISVTAHLVAGSEIIVPDYDTTERTTVKMFSDPANAPASDDNQLDELLFDGIGYWIIENTFIVQ